MKRERPRKCSGVFYGLRLQNCVIRVDCKGCNISMNERIRIKVIKIFGGQMMLEHVRRQKTPQGVEFSEDTEKLRRELKRMREENRKLKHIISYGNISTLETLIDQYMDYSRIYLKKIAIEILDNSQ